jgi:hypothetical protein
MVAMAGAAVLAGQVAMVAEVEQAGPAVPAAEPCK